MRRKSSIAIAPILIVLLAVCGAGGCADRNQTARTQFPVILIGLDTVRGDHLRVFGKDDILTPNIDRLAADGVYFRQAQATAPWTGPSFASILTGLLPYRHGFLGGDYGRLTEEFTTLAEILRDRGYTTGSLATVGWLAEFFGLTQGFDYHQDHYDQGNGQSAIAVTDEGLAFARVHATEPFFLFLHYFDAHAPYTPPPPFDRLYYDGDEKAPGPLILDFLASRRSRLLQPERKGNLYGWLQGVTDLDFPVKQYAAGVSHVDDHVGQVIRGLQDLGLYDRALIVLVADHGEHLGEHDFYFTHALPFQEVQHVPLIVKWPGQRHAGTVVRQRVSTLDVLPTVLAALDLPIPEGIDGVDLRVLAEDPGAIGASKLVSEQGSDPGDFTKAVVVGDWKLMVTVRGDSSRAELFDLAADPGETQDLAARHPEKVQDLTAHLWAVCAGAGRLTAAPPSAPLQENQQTRNRLRSLGYTH